MAWDELGRMAEEDNQRDRDRWIGVYIGVLAVILAVCSMGGENAAKEATLKNIEAANTWAFFQAKNMRRQLLRVQVDDFEMLLASTPDISANAKSAIEAKIVAYKEQDHKLTTDPEKREGLDELWAKGKELEAERDTAMRQDPYFDYAQAFLQIAIVLASVAIISGGSALLMVSGVLGLLGILLTINGFTLWFAVPFLG
jgi:hypothetical protein